MARVALPLTPLVPNAGIADPAGTALVAGAGNGLQIPAASGYNPIVFLRVANASGGTAVVTVLAGSQPSAISAGQGPVSASVLTGTAQWLGPFDSSRLQQPDGSLIIEANAVVTVTAFSIDGRRV
jgi:hypothetical protein